MLSKAEYGAGSVESGESGTERGEVERVGGGGGEPVIYAKPATEAIQRDLYVGQAMQEERYLGAH